MIFGLPIHPLVVHAVVVFVPVLALALLVLSVRSSWRDRYRWAVAGLAVVAAVAAFIANQSGEDLQSDVRQRGSDAGLAVRFGDHPDQGSNAQLFTIVTAAVVVVAAASSRAPAAVKRFEPAFHGLAVVAALGAAGMVTLAGHSGATLVYKDVGTLVLLPPTPVPAATPAAQAGATPTPSAAAPIQIAVTLAEFSFTPSELRVKTGAAVTVLATNSGIRTHTLSIPAIQANTGDMGAGTTVNLSFTAPAPGRYDFLCTIGSHAESGMVGVLIVDP